MYRQSRSLALLLLLSLFAAACGDSPDLVGSDGDDLLVGKWHLVETEYPLIHDVASGYYCQDEAEAQGYSEGYLQRAVSDLWLNFKADRTFAMGLAFRIRCVFEHLGDVHYTDWSDQMQVEEDIGSYRRSGNDVQVFYPGWDPETDPPTFVGKLTGSRMLLSRFNLFEGQADPDVQYVFERH